MDFQFLRDCITALRESPDPGSFYMGQWVRKIASEENNWCGTPACVLGHYAMREAMRAPGPERRKLVDEITHRAVTTIDSDSMEVTELGGLNCIQVAELFGSRGCGDAATLSQAIHYIERFIVRHGGSLEDPKLLDVCAAPEWEKLAGVKEPVCPLT